MTRRYSNRPVAVYRCFDADGTLLYIGCSHSPFTRADEHCAWREWALGLARIDVEWFPDRETALAAEKVAIGTDAPLWNVHHANAAKISGGAA